MSNVMLHNFENTVTRIFSDKHELQSHFIVPYLLPCTNKPNDCENTDARPYISTINNFYLTTSQMFLVQGDKMKKNSYSSWRKSTVYWRVFTFGEN